MKPLLESAPLTYEDFCIFAERLASDFRVCSAQQDRRDAELMLQLTHYDHWERDYTRDRVRSVATAFRLVWSQI